MTKDTEKMVQSLCLRQRKQYLFEWGFGRGQGRASFNGHTLQVPFLLPLKGNILCFCILFILVATSFSQTQNLLHLKYSKTIVQQYFDSDDARTHRAPRSPEDSRPTARWTFSALAQAAHTGMLKMTEKVSRNTQISTYDHIFIVLTRQTQWSLAPASYLLLINRFPISSLFSSLWLPHGVRSSADSGRQFPSQSANMSKTPREQRKQQTGERPARGMLMRHAHARVILLFSVTHHEIPTAFAIHRPSCDPRGHPFCPPHTRVATSSPRSSLWTATHRTNRWAECFFSGSRHYGRRTWSWGGFRGAAHRADGDGDPCAGGAQLPRGERGWGWPASGRAAEGAGPLQAWRGSSPRLHPAPVVNVLITALMSCKWNPTSKYIRVMSSHLTNGDLIELLIGCLFPPRFMTPRAGAVRGGRGEGPCSAPWPPQPAPRLGRQPAGPRLAQQPVSSDIVSPPFCEEK